MSLFIMLKKEHAGIDAQGLPEDLELHHLIVNDFDHITAEQNVCIASIPTVYNPSLAPPGKALVHAYCAANEPYSRWEGIDRKSPEYKQLKVGTFEAMTPLAAFAVHPIHLLCHWTS